MKVRIHLKDKTVVDIDRLTAVNVQGDKVIEFTTEKVCKIPLRDDCSYVFVGTKTAISGAEILYIEFD